MLLSTACHRGEGATADGTQTPALDAAADTDGATATPSTASSSASARALIDGAAVSRCRASYNCGLSHPGLGSRFNETAVDLAACTKTVSSESGPWESQPPPPGQIDPRRKSKRETTKIDKAACARVGALAAAVTDADARDQEPAHMDSTACSLRLTCGTDAAPIYTVQRQTLTGGGHVVELIRAIQAAR